MREDRPVFGGEKEADYNRVLTSQGGSDLTPLSPRTDLPGMTKLIPDKPPEDFPKFDPAKPDETDFQLIQGVSIVNVMATQSNASTR